MTYRQDINPQNDASCIGNARGKARRAKRHTAHRGRQQAQADLNERLEDIEGGGPYTPFYLKEDAPWGDCDGEFDEGLYYYDERHTFEDMAKAYDNHHRFR